MVPTTASDLNLFLWEQGFRPGPPPPCEECGRELQFPERWKLDPTICVRCARQHFGEPFYAPVIYRDRPLVTLWIAFLTMRPGFLWRFPPVQSHDGFPIAVPSLPFSGDELYRLFVRAGVLTGWRPPFTNHP